MPSLWRCACTPCLRCKRARAPAPRPPPCCPPHPPCTCDAPTPHPLNPLQKLYAVKGLSEAKAEKMVEAARKVTSVGNWQTGTDCMMRVRCGALRGVGRSVGPPAWGSRALHLRLVPRCAQLHAVLLEPSGCPPAAIDPPGAWRLTVPAAHTTLLPCSASGRLCASRAAPRRSTSCWAAASRRPSASQRWRAGGGGRTGPTAKTASASFWVRLLLHASGFSAAGLPTS